MTSDALKLLDALTPDDLRRRLAQLDAEAKALRVLLRALMRRDMERAASAGDKEKTQ